MYKKHVANNNWLQLKSNKKCRAIVKFEYETIYLSYVEKWGCIECIASAPHVNNVLVFFVH